MIAKIGRGGRTYGLLRYLYGPGQANEHDNPHLVAAWDEAEPDPAVDRTTTLQALAARLDEPLRVVEGQVPRHVWHCSVRTARDDRTLSDEEWAEIARDIVDAAGLAQRGDDYGCRWIAVRHAPDHIHIAVTLARQDGRRPQHHNDALRLRDTCRRIEARYGLQTTSPADKTAAQRPVRAEVEKAQRRGLAEPPRVMLAQAVRTAAAAAENEKDFFARLEAAGLRLKCRTAPSGDVTGYAVALPGDRSKSGSPVWFSGSRLAPDLSLPRVRARWSEPLVSLARTTSTPRDQAGDRVAAWQQAARAVEQATAVLVDAGDEERAAVVAALGDVLTVAADQAPSLVRGELAKTARSFERAARAPLARRAEHAGAAEVRRSARHLALAGRALNSDQEAAAALALLLALTAAVAAARHWHASGQFAAHAEAAGLAGRHLGTAVEHLGGSVYRGVRYGFDAQAAARPDYQAAVRQALPTCAQAILADPAWPALAATLRAAEAAGQEPAAALATVAAQRELGSADSVAQVLTWRLESFLTGGRPLRNAGAAATARSTVTVRPMAPPAPGRRR